MKGIELARITEVIEGENNLIVRFDNGITVEFRNEGGKVVVGKRGQ